MWKVSGAYEKPINAIDSWEGLPPGGVLWIGLVASECSVGLSFCSGRNAMKLSRIPLWASYESSHFLFSSPPMSILCPSSLLYLLNITLSPHLSPLLLPWSKPPSSFACLNDETASQAPPWLPSNHFPCRTVRVFAQLPSFETVPCIEPIMNFYQHQMSSPKALTFLIRKSGLPSLFPLLLSCSLFLSPSHSSEIQEHWFLKFFKYATLIPHMGLCTAISSDFSQ